MPVGAYALMVLAIWPALGLVLLKWLDRRRRARDPASGVPPIRGFGDLMIQFYAWPLLIIFLLLLWRKQDHLV